MLCGRGATGVSRFVATPLIAQEKFVTIPAVWGTGRGTTRVARQGRRSMAPAEVSNAARLNGGEQDPRNPGTPGSAPSEDRSGLPDRFSHVWALLRARQNSSEVSTGMTSKSARSFQRSIHGSSAAAFSASITWKQRAPSGSTQLATIGDALRQHAAQTLEALGDGGDILEPLDDHEQHDGSSQSFVLRIKGDARSLLSIARVARARGSHVRR